MIIPIDVARFAKAGMDLSRCWCNHRDGCAIHDPAVMSECIRLLTTSEKCERETGHTFYQMNGHVGCMNCGAPGTMEQYLHQPD